MRLSLVPWAVRNRIQRDAVVKIFNTRQRAGFNNPPPWQRLPVELGSGSGALIDRNLVLTAAHVVADSQYVQLQKSGDQHDETRRVCTVKSICHEIDLALLEVKGADDMPYVKLGDENLPELFDTVSVAGFPLDAKNLAVTEGVVSRVELAEYTHSFRPALALTVDAAINNGNSGGPLLNKQGEVVGVAFQKMVATGVELQGHAVPAPYIHRFLKAARNDLDQRMPSLCVDIQTLASPVTLQWLKMPKEVTGVLVSRLNHDDRRSGLDNGAISQILEGDVITQVQGKTVDNFGMVQAWGQRINFSVLVDMLYIGDMVHVQVWRDEKLIDLEFPVGDTRHIVKRGQYDTVPKYDVVGGFVFQPLSLEYLRGWPNPADRPSHLVTHYHSGQLTPERSEYIILAQILSDDINVAYGSGFVNCPILEKINGQPVKDMEHMRELITSCTAEYLVLDMVRINGPYKVVFPRANLEKIDEQIRERYHLPPASQW